ncbi:O-antigen ligase family protein [Methylobacterium sp. E-045]|uniref:O-antigen ligase family protein n=1 Tax=Methylobacterium sp. E-045 TaxID=2836575 RepID=UPI001FBAD0DF|nr:O-antigen ligase family protein [Methylobacterium sp. E-045]MCJ2130026.1 O-antigen ligase family protein [Methylobacterium sp. E-045]
MSGLPPRAETVARLRVAGAVTLAVLPVAMALANRSSPTVVGIAAMFFVVAGLIEDARGTMRFVVRPLVTPIGLAALGFVVWSLVSIAWSPVQDLSWRNIEEFLPTVAGAYLLARLAPGNMPAFTPRLAAWSIALAGLYIVVALATHLPLHRAMGSRVALFVFNRPALTILPIMGPLAYLLYRRGHGIAALLVLVVSTGAILRSISGAAAMGLAAGAVMSLVAVLTPRRVGLAIVGGVLALSLILAPVEGDILQKVMPEAVHDRLVQSSSRARVAIARSFGAAVAVDPWKGAGFGTSARFIETPVAARIEPGLRPMLAVGHPHNIFLQIWAELGIVGAILIGAILMMMVGLIGRLPRGEGVVALGLVASCTAVAFVEHGAWQGWWIAAVGAAIAWTREAAMAPGAPCLLQAASASTRFRPEDLAR